MDFKILIKKNTYILVSFSNGERSSHIPLQQLKTHKIQSFYFLENITSEKKVWDSAYNWVEQNHPHLLI